MHAAAAAQAEVASMYAGAARPGFIHADHMLWRPIIRTMLQHRDQRHGGGVSAHATQQRYNGFACITPQA